MGKTFHVSIIALFARRYEIPDDTEDKPHIKIISTIPLCIPEMRERKTELVIRSKQKCKFFAEFSFVHVFFYK